MLAGIDRVFTQQALITGQVRDVLTGRPPRQVPTVLLLYQAVPGAPERRYPLTARVHSNGLFVFPGNPTTAFPRLSGGSTLDLVLRVTAARYQAQSIAFSLSEADLTPVATTREIDGRSFELELLGAPLFDQMVDLLPEPLHLNGRVVEADDPETPVPGVDVRLFAPGAIGSIETDAGGYFRANELPVVSDIRIQLRRPGFVPLNTELILDYRQPVNQITLLFRHR